MILHENNGVHDKVDTDSVISQPREKGHTSTHIWEHQFGQGWCLCYFYTLLCAINNVYCVGDADQ